MSKEFYLKLQLEDETSCCGCHRLEMADFFNEWRCLADGNKIVPSAGTGGRPRWCPLVEASPCLQIDYDAYDQAIVDAVVKEEEEDVCRLDDEQQKAVAYYIRSLDSKRLVSLIHHWKDMPTCLEIVCREIARRLLETK